MATRKAESNAATAPAAKRSRLSSSSKQDTACVEKQVAESADCLDNSLHVPVDPVQTESFIARLRAVCAQWTPADCVDAAERKKLGREKEILEDFMEAVENEEAILIEGELADKDDVGRLGDADLEAVSTRLQRLCAGLPVGAVLPFQDDTCHFPGCDEDHCYDDGYFDSHCDSCCAWLSEATPIFCLRHVEKPELTTCEGCNVNNEFLGAGYTDDSGNLQKIRATPEALQKVLKLAAQRAGAASGREFFLGRDANKALYTATMNAVAAEHCMGSDDNFDFLEDHANELLEEMFQSQQ